MAISFKRYPVYLQHDTKDCGPTCVRMIAKYYGRNYSLQTLRDLTKINRDVVNLLGVSEAAEGLGFKTVGARINAEVLKNKAPLPCIVHWEQNHFVVLYEVKKKKLSFSSNGNGVKYVIGDPRRGILHYNEKDFIKSWSSSKVNNKDAGVVMLLEPTQVFFQKEGEKEERTSLFQLFRYLVSYKDLVFQLVLGLLIGVVLQMIFPFLTQSIVDVGIQTKNIGFIYIILFAQLMLFLGRIAIEFIRGWILLFINTRINITILSEFLIKLMKLPLSFFDIKVVGDIMQRMNDHQRIENFLTGTSLNILFSTFNIIFFSAVLAYYNTYIFLIFIFSSALYLLWVTLFLRPRKALDMVRFDVFAKNHNAMIQLVEGMQEIKLNNCEVQKRWEWERIQARLFKLNFRNLALGQNQQAGAFFINEGKNIFITFLAAKSVIDGDLTLGAMLAIQYIIGQLNGPIEQFSQFIMITQDAKLSLDRLNEIHQLEDEEKDAQFLLAELPSKKDIKIRNLSFTYPGAGNSPVLKNINLDIPEGKITAIVGVSGSGKTTLLKLLLRFYEAQQGDIMLDNTRLSSISPKVWRSKCGTVMQDGFIFSDSIGRNIGLGEVEPNQDLLIHAATVANIIDFIDSLPLGFNSKIGAEGNGISAGQKQRLLIARSVYKNPEYIFFDEATNALDANNERKIMENLDRFFEGRTVIVVAHRLSTVKNADQIVVLDNGEIIERGNHEELTALKGAYFNLVKNQLELGK
ncbi:MAG: peptidase domain-containing ABC transporter [Bacteroidota bacterium]